ncbi:hypothetical protein KA012_00960 [Candidatus Woesebacteria bacterium]|nr:hypothetical protein [Candidatus Woesebacteria bacterium]
MTFQKQKSQKIFFTLIAAFFLVSVFVVAGTFYSQNLISDREFIAPPDHFVEATATKNDATAGTSETTTGAVKGDSTGTISFSSPNTYRADGGVIMLSASQSPTVMLDSYQVEGMGTFTVYPLGKMELLNYLVYTRDDDRDSYRAGIHQKFSIDSSSLAGAQSFQQQIYSTNNNYDQKIALNLPVSSTGVWYLTGQVGDHKIHTVVVRSNLGAIIHGGDNTNIFWVQDSNYTNVAEANIELLNLENSISSLGQLTTDQSGLASNAMNEALDVAVVTKGDDLALIPVHLANTNYRMTSGNPFYSSFDQRKPAKESYIFTDRFLYKPGDTIYYKAVIREDDDADYTIKPDEVVIEFKGGDSTSIKRSTSISALGTIDGDFQLPKDLETGSYEISLRKGDTYIDTIYVSIAQFRKPSATIEIETGAMMYLPGDTLTAEVSGVSFFGQPIRNKSVSYRVYQEKAGVSGSYDEISFSPDIAWSGEGQSGDLIKEGSVQLDRKGKATLSLPVTNATGSRQFWVVHIQYLDAAGISSTDAVRALIQPGNFVIDSSVANVVVEKAAPVSIHLKKNTVDADFENISISGRLFSTSSGSERTLVQDGLKATTDAQGSASISILSSTLGAHLLELETHDKKGNLVKDDLSLYVSEYDNSYVYEKNIFSVTTDKEKYAVGDTAQVTINTDAAIKNLFVSVGRSYSREYRVISIVDGKGSFSFPVIEKYQPDVYVMVGSFFGENWKSNQTQLTVNTADKEVAIKIEPSQQVYGPGETAQFIITATDGQGNPVQTDMAFWIFDKALFELQNISFGNIFDTFWRTRWFSIPTQNSLQGITGDGAEGGGCFTGDTSIAMADGSVKSIEHIKSGDMIATFASVDSKVLVPASVQATHQVTVAGYLIINKQLQVTPEHKLFVNGGWKTAGELVVGDTLLTGKGTPLVVTSIEWLRRKSAVYNLQIEKYHTFIAGDVYVHNDKGDTRSIFKDTAYWNPHVMTNEAGRAQLSVVLPDNLTTWMAAAVSANQKTQVGDGHAEFMVSKNVISRPIYPPFLRLGDQLELSALIQNFTNSVQPFAVEAAFSGGELENAQQSVTVAAEDIEQLNWPTQVTQAQESASIRVKIQGKNDASLIDESTETLPIYPYAFEQHNVVKTENSAQLPIGIAEGSDSNQAKMSFSVRSQRYPEFPVKLADVVQKNGIYDADSSSTALVLAKVISQYNAAQVTIVDKNMLSAYVKKAVKQLADQSNSSGGWWIYGGTSFSPDTTRFAIEALLQAKSAGFAIDEPTLEKAIAVYAEWQPNYWEGIVEQQYVYSLLPDRQLPREKIELNSGENPEFVARAVMANVRQGFSTLAEGQAALMEGAMESDSQLSWKATDKLTLDSGWAAVWMPTTWSIRAMHELGVDQVKIAKALDYVYRNSPVGGEPAAWLALSTLQYYVDSGQFKPTGQFTLYLGDTTLAQQQLSAAWDKPIEFAIDPAQLSGGTVLRVEKDGSGSAFGLFDSAEVIEKRSTTAEAHHLTLARTYFSAKKKGEPILPGDLVYVQFYVTGLGNGEANIEITDYLPSGLVAIDESLDNDAFNYRGTNSSYATQQLTDQGMKLTFSRQFADTGVYTYETRVIVPGVFDTPPATVRLAADPSIWATTDSSTLNIDGTHSLEAYSAGLADSPLDSGESGGFPWYATVFTLIIAGALLVLAVVKRNRSNKSIQQQIEVPPSQPPDAV